MSILNVNDLPIDARISLKALKELFKDTPVEEIEETFLRNYNQAKTARFFEACRRDFKDAPMVKINADYSWDNESKEECDCMNNCEVTSAGHKQCLDCGKEFIAVGDGDDFSWEEINGC